jgi:phosphatidylglycerophosphate synthase
MGSEKSGVELAFGRGEADRRIAGVAAAARILRELSERGTRGARLSLPEGALAPATLEDIARLSPEVTIEIANRAGPGALAAPRLTTRDTLRATAKPSDGPVSRWLNRPVSRCISALLLRLPGIRPIHATLGTISLAAAMFAALVSGGQAGLVAGGLLFHAASVFDGVDGEIARATFRSSRAGAVLDSVVDVATNFLFILGVTVALVSRHPLALPVGAWGLGLFLLGLVAISWSAARDDRPFSMEVIKRRYRASFPGTVYAWLIRFLTIVTSRDFFALLFALLILAGVPMAILYIFAAAATLWILFVLGGLIVPAPAGAAERSA